MSLWILLVALVPPVLFAVSNLIDKKVVHGEGGGESPWAIVALGAFFDLLFVVPIGLFCLFTNSLPSADIFWPLFFNGISVTFAGWLFFRSIQKEEASRVVAIFQTIPVFGIFLGFYGLNEKLSWEILVAIILLVLGGFTLSITKGKFNKKILIMMLSSAALYAVNDFVLAGYGREVFVTPETGITLLASVKRTIPAILSDLVGKVFFGIIILVGRQERVSFKNSFRAKFGLVGVSSVVYTAGDVIYDVAKLFAPIALVQALCCTQPVFVLIGAIGLTLFCKNFPKEEVGSRSVWQKVFGISLMVAGGILISV
jgi:drug/metabolite transporter (DMT)-like permease